jgi:hypothetical protein
MLLNGNGIPVDKVRAAHYFQLSADQGDLNAQFSLGAMLHTGDGILVDKVRAAYYFQLSADQGKSSAQFNLGVMLLNGNGIPVDKVRAAHYFQLSADQGEPAAQFNYGLMLHDGDGIVQNTGLGIHYLRLAASQGYKEAQEVCMKLSVIDYSVESIVGFLSGNNGNIDFESARRMIMKVSWSYADVVGRILMRKNPSEEELIQSRDVSVFGLLESNGFLMMRIIVARLRPVWIAECRILDTWKELQTTTTKWLSDFESLKKYGEFLSHEDLLKLPFLERSPFIEMNQLLRCFPIQLFVEYLNEFRGFLSCATLLQAVIESRSTLRDPGLVYRGFGRGGHELAGLYASLIDKVIIWRGFSTASKDRDFIIQEFVRRRDGILFEIVLGRGAIAADGEGNEVIIAAESGFKINSVEIETAHGIPIVSMEWVSAWSEADLEFDPRDLLPHVSVRRQ